MIYLMTMYQLFLDFHILIIFNIVLKFGGKYLSEVSF